MIAEIFLPEKLGDKRLIARRSIGIAMQDDNIRVASVYAKRTKTVVESLITIPLQKGDDATYQDRAADAIKKAMAQYKRFDYIRAAIPASIVTFKEVNVPFLDPEKIRMILAYEIEGMLPFSIDEAVIDFIITKKDIEKQTAQILVAAVRNQDLTSILDMYTKAEVEPTSITIDLFAAYGLYQQIFDYRSIANASALIDVGLQSTRIAFLQGGELRLTRSIPRGVANIVQDIAQELNLPVEVVEEKLQTYGVSLVHEEISTKIIQKHMINFLYDIQFTLNSFSLKLNFYEGIGKLLFIGRANNIQGFIQFSGDTLQIPSEAFDCKKILQPKIFESMIKGKDFDWSEYSVALGTACPSPEQELFDLRKKEFALLKRPLVIKQFATAIVLMVTLLGFIGFKGYVQLNTLNDALSNAHAKAMAPVKNILPRDKKSKTTTLAAMVKDAEKVLQERSDLTAAFSNKYKLNPLRILLEITSLLEKNSDELTLLELSMKSQENNEIHASIDGYFKSKEGSGSHFTHLIPLEVKFRESSFFTLVVDPIDATSTDGDRGVRIKIELKVNTKEK